MDPSKKNKKQRIATMFLASDHFSWPKIGKKQKIATIFLASYHVSWPKKLKMFELTEDVRSLTSK